MSLTRSLDETAPLLHNAQRTQQPPDDCSIQSLPEVAGKNRTLGPRLLISLVVDSIPGMARPRRFREACTDQSPYPTVILSYILQNSIQTVSIMITGRLGAEELSAAAFSMMLAYVTGE